MSVKLNLTAAAFAAGLLSLAASAHAAPLGAVTDAGAALKSDARAASVTEDVSYRCWWHRGYRQCGYVRPRVYSYYYAPRPRPYFSLYFGPRYRSWY